MSPKAFDNDVPPLNRSSAGGLASVKTRLSSQHTQKSFSMTAGVSPMSAAAA